MVLNFSWLPPEINSARIFAGAGSGSLHTAASAWDGLASDLSASVSSFQSVLSGLANGAWTGPASLSMAAAAVPYVTWLSGAAAQAAEAAGQARAAATATGDRQPGGVSVVGVEQLVGSAHSGDFRYRVRLCRDVGPGCGRDVGVSRGSDDGSVGVTVVQLALIEPVGAGGIGFHGDGPAAERPNVRGVDAVGRGV